VTVTAKSSVEMFPPAASCFDHAGWRPAVRQPRAWVWPARQIGPGCRCAEPPFVVSGRARESACRISEVLPIPASPRITRTALWPSRTLSSIPSRAARSRVRPLYAGARAMATCEHCSCELDGKRPVVTTGAMSTRPRRWSDPWSGHPIASRSSPGGREGWEGRRASGLRASGTPLS
jgi:hypothetical protein